MDRRVFNKLAGAAAMGAFSGNASGQEAERRFTPPSVVNDTAAPSTLSSTQVALEDKEILIAFDADSGAWTRFYRKSTKWAIQRRPELGISFRLLVPLPNRRANFVLGQKQRAIEVKKLSEHQIRLTWKNPISEHGGVLPVTFTAMVSLKNGAVTFESTLINDSPLVVETIDYPYFGDLSSPARGVPIESDHMWYGNLVGDGLHPSFRNEKGYWGVDFPTKTVESKQSLFCLVQSPQEGIYIGMHDPTQPYLIEFTFEQHPGVLQSESNEVPLEDQISGIPVHLEFRTCHFVFAHPHSTMTLAPIIMRAYDGGWHAGLDLYKQWRSTWFRPRQLPKWVKKVHSWLQLQIDGAEQDYSIPYRDLPAYIDECVTNGVSAIQLVGWEKGGQDGGDPCLDTDPGLGTWQELHQAILYARDRGVKIMLFGKPIWADLTTEWYMRELYKYEASDPYGIAYQAGGYSYTTPTQLAGINNRRRAIMDVQSQAYRDIATKEFMKTVNLGAAGWLFDEVCHHGPVDYSFSPKHGYPAPGYIYGGDMPMAEQFRTAADRVDPDFVFAGEGPQDWLMQYYPVSYFRIDNGSRAVCRYIDPYAPLIVAVTGFDDREMLNLILLNRYIISYEPYNFKGHLTDFPRTLAYGKKIDSLRERYKEWIWDAEFKDTLGAKVSANGAFRYTVFQNPAGKRSVIIVNQESRRAITATLQLLDQGHLMAATPEQPDKQPVSNNLRIPARSAIVVMEQ